uniref:Uncharacterized protein n=1 Tax=viral metagenome TaxID=1070528 RepID=A0A6M3M4J9_9ZZZZ
MAENWTAEPVPGTTRVLTLTVADQAYEVWLPRKASQVMVSVNNATIYAYEGREGITLPASHPLNAGDNVVLPTFKPVNAPREFLKMWFESTVAGATVTISPLPPEEM